MSSSGIFASCTLYISNLPANATQRDVTRLFSRLGRLVDCQLLPGGCGTLVFSQPREAERAYSSELSVFGRPVILSLQPLELRLGVNSCQHQQSNGRRRRRNRNAGGAASQQLVDSLSNHLASQLTVSHDANTEEPTRMIDRVLRANDLDGLRLAASTPSGLKALRQRCCLRWAELPLIQELALSKDRLDTLKCLLECLKLGPQSEEPSVCQLLNTRDKYGYTPLHRAIRANATEVAELLLSHGSDPRIETDRDRRTALHIHLWQNCGQLAHSLLKWGADPEACDADNWTPLHWCAKNGYSEFALHLIVKCRVRLFRSQSCTLSPLKLCLQQVNQRSGSLPLESTWPRLVHLLLRHGSALPSQSYLSDWLAASHSSALSGDPGYEFIVRCLTAEGAAELNAALGMQQQQHPRPLLQLCRLRVRRILSDLCDSRSMLDSLYKLPLPHRVLGYLDLLPAWEDVCVH